MKYLSVMWALLAVSPIWAQSAPQILTGELPSAMFGFGYSVYLQVQGGTPPYTFRLGPTHHSLPPGLRVESDGEVRWDVAGQGVYRFSVQVSDAQGRSSMRDLDLRSDPPFVFGELLLGGIVGYSYEAQVIRGGAQAAYPLQIASGTLPPGLRLDPDGTIRGLPTAGGTFRFTVRSTIYADTSATFVIRITAIVGPDPGDGAPALQDGELRPARLGERYFYQWYTYGGVPPYRFSLAGGMLPPALTLDPIGSISGIPHTLGTYVFSLRVTGSNGASRTAQFSMEVQGNTFSLGVQDLPRATISLPYTAQLQASGGRTPYRFQLSAGELPPGLSLSAEGLLHGTPNQVGNYGFVVRGSDAENAQSTQIYSLAVREPPMRFVPTAMPPMRVGSAYRHQLLVSGGTPPVVFLPFSGSMPEGIELSRSGVISGTPQQQGVFPIEVQIIDGEADLIRQRIVLEVLQASPLLLNSEAQKGMALAPYEGTLRAQGGQGPYRFSLVNGMLPPGLGLGEQGRITGTPEAPGTFEWTARVSDAGNASTDLMVRLEIERPYSMPPARSGQDYAVNLSLATGNTGSSFALNPTAADTRLPAGLLLTADGWLRGRPNITGIYTLSLLMQTGGGQRRAIGLLLRVEGTGFRVTTPSLPTGRIGLPYEYRLQAAGGKPPYRWGFALGQGLPGMTLEGATGLLRGTPTAVNSREILVDVWDADNRLASATFLFSASALTGAWLASVANAASYEDTAVSPGELLTLFGARIGPASLRTFDASQGKVETALAGAKVYFDGEAVPVLYTSESQMGVVAPFGLRPGSVTMVVVEFAGRMSRPLLLPVVPAKPGIFTLTGSGRGAGAILNQNGSVNGESQRARPGEVVVLYATGSGAMTPAGITGQLAKQTSSVLATVKVEVAGLAAEVLYAGNAPGLVEGVVQVNVRLPAGLARGEGRVVLRVGEASSPEVVTVWVE